MSFSNIQIVFLQRLVREHPPSVRASGVARFFSEHYSLGVLVGTLIEYAEHHHLAAKQLLRSHDLPESKLDKASTRAQAAQYGGMSEKSFSVGPRSGAVAVKALGSCLLNGHQLYTPNGAYQVLTPEQAMKVTCQRLMVVENLETFRWLECYSFLDRKDLDIMVMYRGDLDLPIKDAMNVINGRKESIWAFFDFDPAGLVMANSIPPGRLEKIVLPSMSWLENALDTAHGRQLYDKQEGIYGKVLDVATGPGIASLWELMKRKRSAVSQERMHAEGIPTQSDPIGTS